MRLRSIEIKGFKSFADKTLINFDQNITGIVGPNGCGKSNVVDSIRWVLGEQKNKALRLEKMENIIFNGSADKAQANVCEVSITLDNTKNILPTEFQSVTITRTLTRDGDSNYKLNGVNCRLKDIRTLFMDTGISTDSYAIIELKMIDQILNDVDGARRTLIEQAAGVSKFKTRKRETILKLNATEADLDRVKDLLYEIEKNLKTLETQAKKAQQYKAFKEEYKVLSIDLAKHELFAINEDFAKAKKVIQDSEDEKLAVITKLESFEAELEKQKLVVLEKEKHLSEQQKELNSFLATIQQKESDKKIAEQKVSFLNDKINQLQKQTTQTKEIIDNLFTAIEDLEKLHIQDQSKLDTIKVDYDSAKEKLETQREQNLAMRTNVEAAKERSSVAQQKITSLEKNIAIKETELLTLEKNAQQSVFENEERQKQIATIEDNLKQTQQKVDKQKDLVDKLIAKEEQNDLAIQEKEALTEQTRQDLTLKNRTLDAKNNEFKLTKNMVDNLEGFPESIKFLKKNVNWLKDTPLLSDIIYTDENNRVAIEAVLAPYLSNFIVQNETEAYNAIDILSKSSSGKASFLVLDYFNNYKINSSAKKVDDANLAIDLIKVDDQYKNLLQILLDNIYIANENANIQQVYKTLNDEQAVVVSANGQIQKSAQQLSGGAVGLFEGKRLGRLKNLEILEKDIKKLDTETLKLKEKLQTVQNELNHLKVNSYKNTIQRENFTLQNLEKELVGLKSKLDSELNSVEKYTNTAQLLAESITQIKTEIEPLKTDLEQSIAVASSEQESYTSLDNDFKKANELYSELSQQYNNVNILYIQQENKLKSNQQNLQYKQNQLEDNKNRLASADEEINQSNQEVEQITQQVKELENQLITDYNNKEEKMELLSSQEGNYYEIKEGISTTEDNIRNQQKQRQQVEQNIQNRKEEISDLKLNLNLLKERLSIEFNIEMASFEENLELPEDSKDDIKDRLDKVKRKIDYFGDVNPMAEEAYNEMKERFDFITAQRADLEQAKTDLLDTMEEIETTAKEQFLQTFHAVRENFIEVFRSMFTQDDSCDLVLINPDDPLESEIDIMAKPKGKRPQSINQLSGGEKTLTALSLLFGLYLYKPAPFCILDEVDAPLDDANIKKFNDAIKNFSNNSQFIIVTHNKMTMAAVDAIYGVTMVKKGISRVVPVDFSSLN
ncbi:MAG: chromosome segregation protein SMC [Chitinophagales bacterium]|nr:chromosome segregation protein SMC [Chitinophagales bacterium]